MQFTPIDTEVFGGNTSPTRQGCLATARSATDLGSIRGCLSHSFFDNGVCSFCCCLGLFNWPVGCVVPYKPPPL